MTGATAPSPEEPVDPAIAEALIRKSRESAKVIEAFFEERASAVVTCAAAIDRAFAAGGRLFVFGNGGSACDAQHMAVEFCHPIFEKRAALPALALPIDGALLSAIGNDQDFAMGFVRQLELHARPGDVALGMSTSGQSRNVVRALRFARDHGLVTIGFAGRDGGAMADVCEHFFLAPSYSIHRIQEVHTVLMHVLWDAVHLVRGEEDLL